MKNVILVLCALVLLTQAPSAAAGMSKPYKPFSYKNHANRGNHPQSKRVTPHQIGKHARNPAADQKPRHH